MKLKKSLLALTTAATVAVAGTTAAVAEENPTTDGSKGTSITTSLGKQDGDTKTKEEKKQELAGSAQKFFGWKDDASTVDKIAKVGVFVTTIAALVGGIVSLLTNFQKLGKLAK
ncbi:hypothetical protein [Corynebacterium jeikeium]|uniref:hypothetical protein n=1 Tax=Corynebacterium jeikeium TaxID=38289 RepID=UPI00055426F7|nr:hypothetical protein [Corynebacterium jeikeium]